jgi:hypothetical protein
MKTNLQKQLAAIAPAISIKTIWERDTYASFNELAQPGCCFENEKREDWSCWQSEVRALAIVDGEEISGEDNMGGTWEKSGDDPATSNPDISGYEPQMTHAAIENLLSQVGDLDPVGAQARSALEFLADFMRKEYEAQQQTATV